ncbi:phosphate acyltransferase [Methanobrevibacter filiformis]|uniref:Phosphate acetyl/butaryl transferase n=1 Tax=Methanobrevibacter filiformis TaxID=55758 RepID=A0A165Z887_9EURY|nr:phosphate acyltransferase [Methanobrevibacter filiformis]KZX10378.1 phosphate acetyl/butaryl transferase [Methanobrevibacter filiformis]
MIKIVVGLGENENIKFACERVKDIPNLDIEIVTSVDDIIDAFKDDEVDAIIRGSLNSSVLLKQIKNFSESEIVRATYIKEKIDNVHSNNHDNLNNNAFEFLLSPVGIDEGKNIDEKVEIAIKCCNFIKSIGKTPKIAILSSGRKDDYDRSSFIDDSLKESEILTKKLKNLLYGNELTDDDIYLGNTNDYHIKNYYILIEKAINEGNNIIIPPNGVIGNIIFRTLVLLNSWHSYGAIALGLNKIFIDTSRDQSVEGYYRSIKFAYNLAKFNQKGEE